jgi:hypothetical protein
MPVLENLATAAMTVTAAALSVIAFMAWHYSRSHKVLLLATGFLLFLVKGIMLSIGLFVVTAWGDRFLGISVVIDLLILLLFYGAVLQRAGT